MITGQQILEARRSLRWSQRDLAAKAKVPISIVVRAENSLDEPMVTIAQLAQLLDALRVGGADVSPAPNASGDTDEKL